MAKLTGKGPGLSGGERGVGLVESLIALAIVGVAITALLGALSTGSMAVGKTDRRVTAESLARAQMEYTKSLPYLVAPASYEAIAPLPEGYSISAVASPVSGRDSDLQRVTVTVSCD